MAAGAEGFVLEKNKILWECSGSFGSYSLAEDLKHFDFTSQNWVEGLRGKRLEPREWRCYHVGKKGLIIIIITRTDRYTSLQHKSIAAKQLSPNFNPKTEPVTSNK